MLTRGFPDDIDVVEMFAGGGGSGTGIAAVPGTKLKFATNHAKPAKWTYVENHPDVDCWLGDVQAADAIEKFPYAGFFWASPACPAFSTASGETRYFDKEDQMALWADDLDNLTEHQKTRIRSRALMEEVVTYLRHCQEKHGKPVLGFGVENVVQARLWVAELGVSLHQSAIARIEAGTRPVRLHEAVALARVLAVDLQDLLPDLAILAQEDIATLERVRRDAEHALMISHARQSRAEAQLQERI